MVLNVENYLKRISYHREPLVNLDTLRELHRRHIKTIPFENLDIHLDKEIRLNLKLFEKKILDKKRGGFCYELNGLFCALLKQLGFDVKLISARVCGTERIGPEFDHLVLGVNLNKYWLADVGFGSSFLEPIQIKPGIIQKDSAGSFRIQKHDSTYLRLESDEDGSGCRPKYLFTLVERRLEDFTEMCKHHQTSPNSSFTNEKICTIATENGRITLRDQMLIEKINGVRTTRQVTNKDEYDKILRDKFRVFI